ncbi:MAG: hypothetical protein M3162_00960 [Thermoproteota archaeon]|nr:hypothetical protein [Thermoproteota archaeon]
MDGDFLIIAVGQTASKITLDITNNRNIDYLLINQKKDIPSNSNSIVIDNQSWVNPNPYKVREMFNEKIEQIKKHLDKYSNILVIGNLASKFGIAVIPKLTSLIKSENKKLISIVIMPFEFEKNKIYQSGISLNFVSNYSNTTIIMDNQSFLRNNPNLTLLDCYKITNNAIKDITINSIEQEFPDNDSFIATSKGSENIEDVFIDSFSMLIDNSSTGIEKTFVYICPGKEKIDKIDNIIRTYEKISKSNDNDINLISQNSKISNIHFLVKTKKISILSYDPLHTLIDQNNLLDFEPETNKEIKELSHLRDIESLL